MRKIKIIFIISLVILSAISCTTRHDKPNVKVGKALNANQEGSYYNNGDNGSDSGAGSSSNGSQNGEIYNPDSSESNQSVLSSQKEVIDEFNLSLTNQLVNTSTFPTENIWIEENKERVFGYYNDQSGLSLKFETTENGNQSNLWLGYPIKKSSDLGNQYTLEWYDIVVVKSVFGEYVEKGKDIVVITWVLKDRSNPDSSTSSLLFARAYSYETGDMLWEKRVFQSQNIYCDELYKNSEPYVEILCYKNKTFENSVYDGKLWLMDFELGFCHICGTNF